MPRSDALMTGLVPDLAKIVAEGFGKSRLAVVRSQLVDLCHLGIEG